jgi:carbon-monoxide dehydrogenase medium subunit
MKAAPFDLHRPASVAEAVELLAGFGDDGKVLAGGQSLVPLLALRLVTPPNLVDLDRVDELRVVDVDEHEVHVGAMVRHAAALRHGALGAAAPLVTRALPFVGHEAIRNRGTIGGSLAHADPAAELPAVCLALRATMQLAGPDGTRDVPADDFFVSTYTTALRADELLTRVRLPKHPPRSGVAIDEVARRRGDFALAGAACAVQLSGDGHVEQASIALFGVADRPVRADAAEEAMRDLVVGPTGSADSVAADVAEVAELAVADVDPVDSLHCSGRNLRHLARVLTARCLRRALAEAAGG